MISELPLLTGVVHVTLRLALPLIATTFSGGLDTVLTTGVYVTYLVLPLASFPHSQYLIPLKVLVAITVLVPGSLYGVFKFINDQLLGGLILVVDPSASRFNSLIT